MDWIDDIGADFRFQMPLYEIYYLTMPGDSPPNPHLLRSEVNRCVHIPQYQQRN